MLTLTQKIILAYTLVFGIALSGFAFAVYQYTRAAEIKKLDVVLDNRIERIQEEIEEWRNEIGFTGTNLDSVLSSANLGDSRIRIFNRAGKFIKGDAGISGLPVPEIKGVLAGNRIHGITIIRDKQYRYIWAPLDIGDHTLFAAQILAPMQGIDDLQRRQLMLFLLVIPSLLVFTGCAAYFINTKSRKPILDMVETAHLISEGTLDRRLPVPRPNDEIRMLALSLNTMIERIGSAFEIQRRFVADAAHAIRTPLTIINGELDLSEKEAVGELQKSISSAREEGERLARLTEQLLALARLDAFTAGVSPVFRQVRLDELLVDCVRRMSGYAARKTIGLQVYINEAIEFAGDVDRLGEMVRNLIDNAIKYSPSGSIVKLQLLQKPGDFAVITVCDNGPGIGKDELPHVFERFFRSEKVRSQESGSGLGLSIVEQVARLHKGKVTVESTPGNGCTFTVELPLT